MCRVRASIDSFQIALTPSLAVNLEFRCILRYQCAYPLHLMENLLQHPSVVPLFQQDKETGISRDTRAAETVTVGTEVVFLCVCCMVRWNILLNLKCLSLEISGSEIVTFVIIMFLAVMPGPGVITMTCTKKHCDWQQILHLSDANKEEPPITCHDWT